MFPTRAALFLGSLLVLTAACSSSGNGASTTGGAGGTGTGGATPSSSSSSGTGGGLIAIDAGGGGKGGGTSCDPPDAIIALDRTLTMHKTPNGGEPTDAPDYQSSKFYQAITAIEKLVAPPTDATIRFGLDLWPKDSPGCVTLAQKITGTMGTNASCEDGEIAVEPALGTGETIAKSIDPATTKICFSTPTGQGLLTASSWLDAHPVAGRAQYIILVTDGADWDQSCPTPDPLAVTQQLATSGIKTFVVGFSAQGDLMPGGVGAAFLNDMACAGQTAPGFPAPCTMTATGWVAKDPQGAALYLAAGDAAALDTALHSIAVEVCCDCVK